MSKADLEALGRFVSSEVGLQYVNTLKDALVGQVVKDLSLATGTDQVLILIEFESGQRAELAVPDIDPDWERRVAEDLIPDIPSQSTTHSMGMLGVKEPEEKKKEEADGSQQG